MDMRTFYRKLPHEDLWHFCRKCENWPQFGYGERYDTDSRPSALCPRCIQHHRTSRCEWLHLEVSLGPLILKESVTLVSASTRNESGDFQ
jgi:hypothetical protein